MVRETHFLSRRRLVYLNFLIIQVAAFAHAFNICFHNKYLSVRIGQEKHCTKQCATMLPTVLTGLSDKNLKEEFLWSTKEAFSPDKL